METGNFHTNNESSGDKLTFVERKGISIVMTIVT